MAKGAPGLATGGFTCAMMRSKSACRFSRGWPRSATAQPWRPGAHRGPLCRSSRSTSFVWPGSTWAMRAILRMSMAAIVTSNRYKIVHCKKLQQPGPVRQRREALGRPGAEMTDRLAGAEAAEPAAGSHVAPVRQAEEEAAGVEVAGARRVDDLGNPRRLDHM